MVLEQDAKWYANENTGLPREVNCKNGLVGNGNEAFFTRVWKPLSNKHVLKS